METKRAVLRQAKANLAACLSKFRNAQDGYLSDHTELFSNERATVIRSHLDVLANKLLFAHVHLEELWTSSEQHRQSVLELLGSDAHVHTWADEDLLCAMLSFEGYLFQARSFLDVFMFHSCLLFGIESPGTMGRKRFEKCILRVSHPFSKPRAERLLQYVDTSVFGQNQWGSTVKSLRDRIAHRDLLRPGREGWEEVAGVLLDWPTVQGLSLERLAQSFDNGVFSLLSDSVPLLFDRAWISGPAREA